MEKNVSGESELLCEGSTSKTSLCTKSRSNRRKDSTKVRLLLHASCHVN